MTTPSARAEVLDLENRSPQSLVERDPETADRLHSPAYQLIFPAGAQDSTLTLIL